MINKYENILRFLIIHVLGSSDDIDYKVTAERREKWIEKREIELKKFSGVILDQRIIFFSDFTDLYTIIHKNWEQFKPVLLDKKRFEVFYREMEKYRNTVAHGRSLTTTQKTLISGITSDLKNLITIYHNKNEMKDDYFIRISKVSDNLGNTWPVTGSNTPVVRVGDEYEVIVEANDPKDRNILYQLLVFNKFSLGPQESNRFSFEVPMEIVGESTRFIVIVNTPDSEYENESILSSPCIVLPPKN